MWASILMATCKVAIIFTSEKSEAGTGEGLTQALRWRWPLRFEAAGRLGGLTLAEQWVWGGWGSHDQDGFQTNRVTQVKL